MKTLTHLKGLNTIMRNLNKEIKGIKERSMSGLVRSAIGIQRDMDASEPTIPIDWGNLRASFIIVTSRGAIKRGNAPSFKGPKADIINEKHLQTLAKASSLVVSVPKERRPAIIMGFGAYYATMVHEMTDPKIDWSISGSGPKFFELAIQRNQSTILDIIRREAKIK